MERLCWSIRASPVSSQGPCEWKEEDRSMKTVYDNGRKNSKRFEDTTVSALKMVEGDRSQE